MQPVSGYEPISVSGTAAATQVVRPRAAVLHSIFIPATSAGTLEFHNTSTATGTAAANLLFTLDNAQSDPRPIELDMNFNQGITVVVSGDTDCVVLVG